MSERAEEGHLNRVSEGTCLTVRRTLLDARVATEGDRGDEPLGGSEIREPVSVHHPLGEPAEPARLAAIILNACTSALGTRV